jgi:hypothetical protein
MFIPIGNSSHDVEQLLKLSRHIFVKRKGAQSRDALAHTYRAMKPVHQKALIDIKEVHCVALFSQGEHYVAHASIL